MDRRLIDMNSVPIIIAVKNNELRIAFFMEHLKHIKEKAVFMKKNRETFISELFHIINTQSAVEYNNIPTIAET